LPQRELRESREIQGLMESQESEESMAETDSSESQAEKDTQEIQVLQVSLDLAVTLDRMAAPACREILALTAFQAVPAD